MRYRYPRTRVHAPADKLQMVLDSSSLSQLSGPKLDYLTILTEFQRELACTLWRTPVSPSVELPQCLNDVPSVAYMPEIPKPKAEFTVVHPGGHGWSLGYCRWDDTVVDEIFGAPLSSPKHAVVMEALLALEACEAVGGHLFVTHDEDLLIHRDWLQDRMTVFIVGTAEALDFLDVHLKRKGVYAYRASSHVTGTHGYYFGRLCQAIPRFLPTWATAVYGDAELPNGEVVQRYLESLQLRLVSMFEAKDQIADKFYRPANNDTSHIMLRELGNFFPLTTGSFDSLAWLCRYLYGFRHADTEDNTKLRASVILRLKAGQTTNGLINHVERANQPLGQFLRSMGTQNLLAVFYPPRDSIQHRHPLVGVHYVWLEDRGLGIVPRSAEEKAYSLAILDEAAAQAIAVLDGEDPSDYFSKWGVRCGGGYQLLEPYKFVRQALQQLCQFYQEFFDHLCLPEHHSLSASTVQEVRSVVAAKEANRRSRYAIPFLVESDVPMIAGGLAQATAGRAGRGSQKFASNKRSMALYGSHRVIMDVARIVSGKEDQ